MSLWKSMLKNKKDLDICIEILNDYFKVNSFYDLEEKYGSTGQNIACYVKSRELLIKKEYPEVHKLYAEKIKTNRSNPKAKRGKRKICEKRGKYENSGKQKEEAFKEYYLDNLPKRIYYEDFLNFLNKYNTGTLTGRQLTEIAAKRGIKVLN